MPLYNNTLICKSILQLQKASSPLKSYLPNSVGSRMDLLELNLVPICSLLQNRIIAKQTNSSKLSKVVVLHLASLFLVFCFKLHMFSAHVLSSLLFLNFLLDIFSQIEVLLVLNINGI